MTSERNYQKKDAVSDVFAEVLFRNVADACHRTISLRQDSICVKFLHTPQFGRLRGIHQLGACRFVFSGATHCRFAHSLGVCYLAGRVVDHLNRMQTTLKISEEERDTVMLAGLLHDIGHGPFSHLWDNEILPALQNGKKGDHEERGLAVIDFCIAENEIEVPADMLRNAKDMIVGKRPKRGDPLFPRQFLFDIINNSDSGIDVDKMDYLVRDAHYCGTPTKLDPKSIIENMRVVKGRLCFLDTAAVSIYQLFNSRWEQHVEIYQHPDVKAAEFMVKDILLCAEAASAEVDLRKAFGTTEEFCKQKDSILDVICAHTDPALDEARALYARLEAGNLYQLVADIRLPEEEWDLKVTPQHIGRYLPARANVGVGDILIHNMRVNYGANEKDPVASVYFCKKGNMSERFHSPREEISSILPSKFEDRSVRIFYRYSQSPSQVDAIRGAAEAFRSSLTTPHPACRGGEEEGGARKKARVGEDDGGDEDRFGGAAEWVGPRRGEGGAEQAGEEEGEEEFEGFPSQVAHAKDRDGGEGGGAGWGGEEATNDDSGRNETNPGYDEWTEDFLDNPSQVE